MSKIENTSVLNEFLETIRKDGFEKAKEEEDKILKEAKIQADKELKEATETSRKMIENAEEELRKLKVSGEDALKQAGRDLILETKKELELIFSNLVKNTVKEVYAGELLEKTIETVVKEWIKDPNSYTISLKKEDLEKINSSLKGRLKNEIEKGLKIEVLNKVSGGFVLSEKNGNAYYDFTEESIKDALMPLLNPSFRKILE